MTAAKKVEFDPEELLRDANIEFEVTDNPDLGVEQEEVTQVAQTNMPTVYEAVQNVMREIGTLSKDGYNENQRYRFLGIEAITAAVNPALVNNGIVIYPNVKSFSSYDREGVNASGKPTIAHFSTVVVEYTIVGPAGDTIVSTMIGEAADSADKAMNKALATAAKYFYKQFFWIPTGDEDPDAFHEEQSPSGYSQQTYSPAPAPSNSLANAVASAAGRPTAAKPVGGGKNASEAQTRAIWAITHKGLGMDDNSMWDAIEVVINRRADKLTDLTMDEAKILIEHFKSLQ